MKQKPIIIVSGLPRSGTSMMMKMLDAAGIPLLVDGLREADEDNPKGYYEFEPVKQLKSNQSWVPQATGKAVKVISSLLKYLPEAYHYKVVFMLRDIDEILASQHQMLLRRGEPADSSIEDRMRELFEAHLRTTTTWLAERPNVAVAYAHYRTIIEDPAQEAARVAHFLGGSLDVEIMAAAVDSSLYRQRKVSDSHARISVPGADTTGRD